MNTFQSIVLVVVVWSLATAFHRLCEGRTEKVSRPLELNEILYGEHTDKQWKLHKLVYEMLLGEMPPGVGLKYDGHPTGPWDAKTETVGYLHRAKTIWNWLHHHDSQIAHTLQRFMQGLVSKKTAVRAIDTWMTGGGEANESTPE